MPFCLHQFKVVAFGVGGRRVLRWCWVNFQCRASYNFDTVGQGPTALAVGAGGGCLDIFTLIYPFSPLSPSLWETARYRLKYCLKGALNPKQPTNQAFVVFQSFVIFGLNLVTDILICWSCYCCHTVCLINIIKLLFSYSRCKEANDPQ